MSAWPFIPLASRCDTVASGGAALGVQVHVRCSAVIGCDSPAVVQETALFLVWSLFPGHPLEMVGSPCPQLCNGFFPGGLPAMTASKGWRTASTQWLEAAGKDLLVDTRLGLKSFGSGSSQSWSAKANHSLRATQKLLVHPVAPQGALAKQGGCRSS